MRWVASKLEMHRAANLERLRHLLNLSSLKFATNSDVPAALS